METAIFNILKHNQRLYSHLIHLFMLLEHLLYSSPNYINLIQKKLKCCKSSSSSLSTAAQANMLSPITCYTSNNMIFISCLNVPTHI